MVVTPTSSVSLPGLCRDRRFSFLSLWRKSFWLAIEPPPHRPRSGSSSHVRACYPRPRARVNGAPARRPVATRTGRVARGAISGPPVLDRVSRGVVASRADTQPRRLPGRRSRSLSRIVENRMSRLVYGWLTSLWMWSSVAWPLVSLNAPTMTSPAGMKRKRRAYAKNGTSPIHASDRRRRPERISGRSAPVASACVAS